MSTTATKTAETPAPAKKHPKLDPNSIKEQQGGHCWQEFELRLPRDRGLQDIYDDPSCFSAIQGARRVSLKRLDKVRILPFDESWVAEAYVTGASDQGVNLSKPVKHELPARTEALFQDGKYKIEWAGGGYNVVRMSDGQLMTPSPLANQVLALRFLQDLYPKRVA